MTRKMVEVPIEPTQKMIEAAFSDYMGYERKGPDKPPWNAMTMWLAMLRAWEQEVAVEKPKVYQLDGEQAEREIERLRRELSR